MNDINAVTIAAGLGITMTLGTAVFLMMQVVKGFIPSLAGRAAEGVVIAVSAVAVAMALVSVDADWTDPDTILTLVAGTLSTTVVARGVYAQLFRPAAHDSPEKNSAGQEGAQ